MLELIINRKAKKREIALLENGKLKEIYNEEDEENKNEGNIYIGIVKDILPGMQAAFVDIGTEKNGFIHVKDILPQIDKKIQLENEEEQDIRKIIKVNDKLLVQVKKDSNEKKGARISTHIGLPSTLIMLMPRTEIITASQKIQDEEEKERLIKIVREILPSNIGAVIRTAAIGKTKEELKKDLDNKIKEWNEIEEKYNKYTSKRPQLLQKSPNIIEKIIIDIAHKKLEKIIVNDKEEYKYIKSIIKEDEKIKNIKLGIKENEDLFLTNDIQRQNEKVENRKVWLNCGGFITIDKTEALTAIDVNTGKFTGSKNLEETVYRVNYEATIEIANQLRLRDIGGIIIIDYIDMQNKENKQKIEELLKNELKNDRAKTQVEGFTRLDLMELTRKHICSHKD